MVSINIYWMSGYIILWKEKFIPSSNAIVIHEDFYLFSFVCLTKLNAMCKEIQFSSVQFSHSVMSDSLRPHESQHARPPCLSPAPGVYSNSCPLSRWCHPAIQGILKSVIFFPRYQSCFNTTSKLFILWKPYEVNPLFPTLSHHSHRMQIPLYF